MSGGLLPFLLGLALVSGFGFLSFRNPPRSLKAAPCGESVRDVLKNRELDCLTDNVSYGVYRNTLVVGGKFVKEFPRWKEVVECLLKVPYNETRQKTLVYGLSLLMVTVGFVLSPGLLAVAMLYALAFVLTMGTAVYIVGITKKSIGEECVKVMKEYTEFYRRKAKERKDRTMVVN